ncbi:MAG: hypothetical protein ACXACX_15350 [Candidatus Hodarchaeales archaeon]|jgi:hypothetical protein
MRLVNTLRGIESYYLVISGNGTFPEKIIFKTLCKKYNGHEKAIFYTSIPIKKQTGLNALNAIPLYPKKFQINSIIFTVDREHIQGDSRNEIIEHLKSKGIEIKGVLPLQGAFVIKCKSGPYDMIVYCIILGPEVFIEEEVAKLVEFNLNIEIDLSQKTESVGRKAVKSQIKQVLRERGKTIEELILNTRETKLEQIFPNICAVLKKIEEEL